MLCVPERFLSQFMCSVVYTGHPLPISVFLHCIAICRGPGSSVGIATDYGLNGLGSNPGGDEIFRPSRPALGPIQPPVKWVPGLSQGQSAAGACC